MLPAEKAFSDRGLDLELASKLGADYQPGKFTFSYRKGGKLLFEKYRLDEKRFWIEPAGAKLEFWGLDEVPVLPARPKEPLVITEGEFDRIAVLQAVGGYALSVPNGTSAQRTRGPRLIAEDSGYAYLWGRDERLIPEVDQFDKIILFTDGDEAGMILRDELALRLGEARCWFIPYPEGTRHKDANDILRKFGPEVLQRAVTAAKPMRPGNLVSFSQLPPHRFEQALDTGWSWMDKHLRVIRPELMVVTGIPGHGKGVWVRALCANLAVRHNLRSALLTPEDPPHRIKRDLRRFAHYALKTETGYDQKRAEAWLENSFRISTPRDDEDITMAYVEGEMASAALHHNCQIFVVDPWNEITHNLDGLTETLYTERALVRLKRAARRYGLLLIIVAHPRKVLAGQEPDLYSISGSANWKNKADHGIIIHRLEDVNDDGEGTGDLLPETHVIIEKSKDHETMGLPGRVLAKLNKETFDYVPAEAVMLNPGPEVVANQPAKIADEDIPF